MRKITVKGNEVGIFHGTLVYAVGVQVITADAYVLRNEIIRCQFAGNATPDNYIFS
jgi:hypothetical protein